MTNVSLPPGEHPVECALGQFHQAADRLHLEDGMREVLANTTRAPSVPCPVTIDDRPLPLFPRRPARPHHKPRPPHRGTRRLDP